MANKINENALTKCDRCECLIVSDSSNPDNDFCIHPKSKDYEYHNKHFPSSGDGDDDDGIVLKSRCQSSVKITLQTHRPKCKCNETETSSTSASVSDSTSCSRRLQTDLSMKHICFRMCRRKKNKDFGTETVKKDTADYANQTSKVAVREATGDSAEDKSCNTECPCEDDGKGDSAPKEKEEESSIEDMIKKYVAPVKLAKDGSGGNTNAIIIPASKLSGDNFNKLEDLIRTEIRNSDRKIEEVLNELYRQRREIKEVKDLVEILARTVREQLFIKNGKNGLNDLLEDMCKKNCLERKSNTLSLSQTADSKVKQEPEIEKETAKPLESPKPPEEEKKKTWGFFSWCK